MRTTYPGVEKGNIGQATSVQALMALSSVSQSRDLIARGLGQMYGTERDVYEALGYKKYLDYSNFSDKYKRQDICQRIIRAYPNATWRGEPIVQEDEDPEVNTPFEVAWADLVEEKNLYHYFARADILAGIGRYSVLYLGFDDVTTTQPPINPVVKGTGRELLYIQPFSEVSAKIKSWVKEPSDPRFGLPEVYALNVTMQDDSSTSIQLASGRGQSQDSKSVTKPMDVHWSRVVHIAEGLLESNVYGTPRLEAIYNRLDNLELILGGSGEMFWRGALPGIALEQDKQAKLTTVQAEALNDEIDEYVHNMRRVLRLKGMKANNLAPTVANPKFHVDVQLMMISGTTGIPVRILTGAERGELASTQDKENWESRVDERRKDHAEPIILKQFISRCQDAGVLPELPKGVRLNIIWPDINALDAKAKAEIAELVAKALKAYIESGADMIIPPQQFLTSVMGYEEDEAKTMLEDVSKMLKEENEDLDPNEPKPEDGEE